MTEHSINLSPNPSPQERGVETDNYPSLPNKPRKGSLSCGEGGGRGCGEVYDVTRPSEIHPLILTKSLISKFIKVKDVSLSRNI